jgi:uncharacterized protein (DUF4415 family)
MPKSKRVLGSNLVRLDATTDEEIARQIAEDPDTAPELTDEMLEEAELYEGDRFVRQVGRPKGSGKKELVTLRIDRDVLDRFRADGPGWQTRLNDTLRAVNEGGQFEEVRRKTFAEGYAMAMQAVQEQASRAAPGERGSAPRWGRARRRQRGTNARMVEEILQAAAPRPLRPAEIRKALQDKGVAMALTSIRHALSQLETRKRSQASRRYKTSASSEAP